MLPVSLDCQFLFTPWVFSYVYLFSNIEIHDIDTQYKISVTCPFSAYLFLTVIYASSDLEEV
jgi:hypothetical protein